MPVLFRTAGAWGPGQGADLTPAQVDGNFWDHEQRIDALESNPPVAVNIVSFEVNGTELIIHLSDSTEMGPIELPVLTFRFMGEYAAAMMYAALDTFTKAGQGLFYVLVDHTSASTFDPDALGPAVTAGSFVINRAYIIQTIGSTDFTLIGAASNTVGLEFTATGVGSGTGTAAQRLYHLLLGVESISGGAYTASVPTEGGTVTTAAGELRRLLRPAAPLNAVKIVLPPAPSDGQIFELMTRQVITAVSVVFDPDDSPADPDDSPSGTSPFMLTPNMGASWMYSEDDTTWTRRY